jgi:hypothetical protein
MLCAGLTPASRSDSVASHMRTIQLLTLALLVTLGTAPVLLADPLTFDGTADGFVFQSFDTSYSGIGENAANSRPLPGPRINDKGEIVPSVSPEFTPPADLINFPNAVVTATNNVGQFIGYFEPPVSPGLEGFVGDSNGDISAFSVSTEETWPSGINDLGQIVGGELGGIPNSGWLRNPDGSVDLQRFSALYGLFGGCICNVMANDINNDGQIVGSIDASRTSGGQPFEPIIGYVLNGDTPTFIHEPYESVGSLVGTDVTGINSQGQIAGLFNDSRCGGCTRGFLATPIPEPSTFLLLANVVGIVSMVFRDARSSFSLKRYLRRT